MKKHTTKRILALFLAVVLAVGMLPMSALAAGGIHGDTGSNPPGKGGVGTSYAGNWQYEGHPFTRYTLVEFPKGVSGNNWETYTIKGSVDISPADYSQYSNIKGFATDAMRYRTRGMTNVGGYSYPAGIDYSLHDGWHHPNASLRSEYRVHSETEVFPAGSPYELPRKASTDSIAYSEAMASDPTIANTGMLLYMFTEANGNGERTYNRAFDHLLTDYLNLPGGGEEFAAAGQRLRLLVEPGFLERNSKTGEVFAMTLRDAAAYSYYMNEGDSSNNSESTLLYNLANFAALKAGLVMYERRDGFTEPDGNGGMENVSEPIAFYGAKDNEENEGNKAGQDFGTYVNQNGNTSQNLRFFFLRRILFGLGTGNTTPRYCNAWDEGKFAGYGLGILLPGNMSGGTNLTVTKMVTGGWADRNQNFDFEVTLDNLPTGATVTSATEGFSFSGNKATFALKDEESCTMSISGMSDGDTPIDATIKETENTSSGYQTSYNGGSNRRVQVAYNTSTNVTVTNSKNGLSVKKVVDANGKASYPEGTEFTFSVFASIYANGTASEVTTPVSWTRFNADGTYKDSGEWSALGNSEEYPLQRFTLKDGEFINISGLPAQETNIQITEQQAKLPNGTVKDITGDATTITWDGNGATKTDNQVMSHWVGFALAGNQEFAPSVTFTNGMEAGDNRAHLIIDYNFNGAWATIGDGTTSATVDCGYVPYDFTDATKNVIYGIKPSLNGEALTVGKEYSDSVTCAKCGGRATMTFKYKGLYDAPTGGNAVGDSYQLTHPGLTILYVQWEKTFNMSCNCSNGSTPVGDADSNIYPIYWDYNYYGSAVTTSMGGYCTIWKRLDKCELTYDDEGNITGHSYPNATYTPVKITIPWSYPGYRADGGHQDMPYRQGWDFMGWSTTPGAGKGLFGDAAKALENKGGSTGNPEDPTFKPADPGKAMTYYAIWKAKDINWNANGGHFDMSVEPSWTEGPEWVYNSEKTVLTWQGWINSVDVVPILKRYPVREGYTFEGWYYDPYGSVEIDETETGLNPGRTYYAGWTPQPVKVNYYDVRQGTSLITTQTYNYNDLFSPAAAPTDTDGQMFTGWKVMNTGANASAPGTHLQKDIMGMTFHDTGTKPVEDKTGGYWEIDLVASWNEKTVDYTTNIVWDDMSNNDGMRPKAVHIGLVSSVGNQLVADEWVTGETDAPTWSHTFTELPVTTVDASVEKITYRTALLGYRDSNNRLETIKDTTVSSADILANLTDNSNDPNAPRYTYALDNISRPDDSSPNHWVGQYNGAVYMTHELVRINWPFHVYWQDDYNNDGFRPAYVSLDLYREGELVKSGPYHATEAVCETSEHNSVWCFYFPNLLKFHNQGELIRYDGAVHDPSLAQVNERVPADSDKYDMAYANGGTNMDHNGVTFSRVNDTAAYFGRLIWNDGSNRDGIRPSKVTVRLVGDTWNQFTSRWEEKVIDTITVAGDMSQDEWSFVFVDAPVYSGGHKIVYSVVLGDLNASISEDHNGYSWEQTAPMVATATHVFDTTSVDASVSWADENNEDALRPSTIRVRLYADGAPMSDTYTAILSGGEAEVWTHSFTNLPRCRVGKVGELVRYTIGVEEVVKNELYGKFISMANGEQEIIKKYVAAYRMEDGTMTEDPTLSFTPTAILTHTPQDCTINAYISWHDDNNKDGKRPDSVQVNLYKRVEGKNAELLRTLTMSAGRDNSWTYKVSELPLYEDGKLVRYYVDVSEDFRAQLLKDYNYTVSMQDNIVHLYYKTASGSITTAVNWADSDNNDGLRPENLTVSLYANGEKTDRATQLLSAENDWTVTWDELPAYYSDKDGVGQAVQYSVQVNTEGMAYAATYTPASASVMDNTVLYVTMTHGTDIQTVEGTLYWNDAADRDGKRPDSVEVQLYADGQPVPGAKKTVSGEGNAWTVAFEGMPVLKDGKAIYYTVALSDNTGSTYTHMTTGTDIYLSYRPVEAVMYVSFQFDDRNNADGHRPSGLYLRLTADGKPVDEAEYVHTVSFDRLVDGSRWEFGTLPVYSTEGKKIDYCVEVVFDGEQFGGDGYTATPSKPIQLSDKGGAMNQVIVKLAREADTDSQIGSVYWFDNDNQRGNRPTKLTFSVHNSATSRIDGPYTMDTETMKVTDKNGAEVGRVNGITEWGDIDDSRWDYEIFNLPKNTVYEDGVSDAITYWATVNMSGLSNWYTNLDGQATGMDMSMTHKNYEQDRPASTQTFDVSVVWADNANAWNYRPATEGVDVTLLANGEPTNYKAHLNRDNGTEETPDTWTYHFDAIPTYLNGHAVRWTAAISDHAKYLSSEAAHGTYSVITMTQVGSFDLTARWNDDKDNDAKRLDSVGVVVLADGQEVSGSPVILSGDGEVWTAHVENLPVWRTNGANSAVSYSFRWTAETASALNGLYTANPTMNGAAVEGSAFYAVAGADWGNTENAQMRPFAGKWETTLTHDRETMQTDFRASVTFEDEANRDGIRPETVYVTLMADGIATGEPVAVTGSMNESTWSVTWSDLYVYDNGTPIVYTVALANADTYTGYVAGIDESNTQITLSHTPIRVSVTATLNWLDKSELHYKGDSPSETYARIPRVDTFLQLLANGEPVEGKVVKVLASDYEDGDELAGYVKQTWNNLYEKENGKVIDYTFTVTSPDLNALLADGFGRVYDFSTPYDLSATISHDLYDVRGTVYFLRDDDPSFLLADVPVTAYLYNKDANTYTTVGSTRTNDKGEFELLNLPQGLLTIRATYNYANAEYAGSAPVSLDRMDNAAKIVVDRDSEPDSDLYLYNATGHAFYQTNSSDDNTITPVPEGSIVLLYHMPNGSDKAEYLSMTTTDANGGYRFENLTRGKYLVNVVFGYNGGTYTFDNEDANGLSFVVAGADAKWPDVVKQVNADVPVDPENPEDPKPVDPDPVLPKPCVVSGKVYYSDNGQHTTEPVEDVDVYIYTADTNVKLAQTKTDKDGAWSVEGLAAQNYIAIFTYQGAASRVLAFTVSTADYERGTYEAATQYFDRNTQTPVATIQGVILSQNGSTENAMVKIMDEQDNLVDFAYVGQNGEYSFAVPAGKTYRTQIVRVGTRQQSVVAGTPGTGLTTLDYFTLSGKFVINGAAQAGQTVAVYKEQADKTFKAVTATLTDAKGNYTAKVAEAGNYKVISYMGKTAFEEHLTSIGLPGTTPVVKAEGETYAVSGTDAYDSLTLRATENGIVRVVKTLDAGTGYALAGLKAGVYELTLVKGGNETRYYVDCPDTVVTRSHRLTISGNVKDESGKVMLGAIVSIFDQNGKQVGEDTVITDGSFRYAELPEGSYTIRTTYPVDGVMLADKTTMDADSYGKKFANGIPGGETWTLNINAIPVTGKVTDQKGNPIEGATVVVKHANNPDLAYGVTTDKVGNWSMGVAPGSYVVDAMFEVDDNHIYHAVEKASVHAKDPVTNVALTINRYVLSGNVVKTSDNTAMGDVEVTVAFQDGTVAWSGKTNEKGSFAVTIYSDTYTVTATDKNLTARETVAVAGDQTVTLKLDAPILLSGVVYDADGAVVSDAIVHYDGKKSGTVYTNEKGEYSVALTADEMGTYTIYAEAMGMETAKETVSVTGNTSKNLTLVKTETPGDAHLISGVVVDNKGHRLESAVVTALYGNDKELSMKTSTNRNGAYRFMAADGTYYLTATYTSETGYTYQTNAETAIHVNGAGVVKNLVITLSHPVSVTVVDTKGNPVPGATVTFMGATSGSIDTDANGKAVIDLAGGDYTFSAIVGNRESDPVKQTVKGKTAVSLTVGALGIAAETPVVTPEDGLAISGTVYDGGNLVVAGATVTLERFDYDTNEWKPVDVMTSAEDGTYRFGGLTTGCYRVSVAYTTTVKTEGTPSAYEITGVAMDENGNPYINAEVSLIGSNGKLIQSINTGSDGVYTFTHLKNGSYTVKITPVNGDEPIVRENVAATPKTVVVEGVATNAAGKVIANAKVSVTNGSGVEWVAETGEDGAYRFSLPADGEYTVTITYPKTVEVETAAYKPEPNDPNAPMLNTDAYKVSGIVKDTDGNALVGVTVELKTKNGAVIQTTTTDQGGKYAFSGVAAGEYIVTVTWGELTKDLAVNTNGHQQPTDPDDPSVGLTFAGIVVSDYKVPLKGASVQFKNLDTNETLIRETDAEGRFSTGELPVGRYEIVAVYNHNHGESRSDRVLVARSRKDITLVVILSYVTDVNGDGKNETVYAGPDGAFDTSDDYYCVDIGGDGIKEKVNVGDDHIPGTPDDFYMFDVDKNGTDEKVFVGKDGIPGTKDDWYEMDMDGDGTKDKVFVGDDRIPGTADDWYEKGGRPEVGIVIWFDANGGKVNGKDLISMKLVDFRNLPSASRDKHSFLGWFTAKTGGEAVKAEFVKGLTEATTLFAQWKETTSGGSSFGGGGGDISTPVKKTVTVTFDVDGGSPVAPMTVDIGSTIQAPLTAKGGYRFDGWLLGSKQFDFKTKVNKDLTLTAKWTYVGVTSLLTTEHIAYIAGMPDGNVYPMNNITRAEVAMIFYRLLNTETRNTYKTAEHNFTDVVKGAWYETAVATLARMGIVNGKGDNKFDPNGIITRAEFAAIAARFDKLEDGKMTFPDVDKNHWAYKEIASAAAKGWVKGYDNGNFGPNNNISRAEVMTLVNRVLGRDAITVDSIKTSTPMIQWPDNADTTVWYYLAIQEATNAHASKDVDGVETWTDIKETKVGNQ